MLWLWLGMALAAPLDSLVNEVATAPSWGEGATLVQAEYKLATQDPGAQAQLFSLLQVTSALNNWSIPPHPSVGRAYLEAAVSDDPQRRTLALQNALAETPMPSSTNAAREVGPVGDIPVRQPAVPSVMTVDPPPPPAAVRAYLGGYLTREPVQSTLVTYNMVYIGTSMQVFEGGSSMLNTRDLAAAFNDKEAMKKIDYSRRVSLPVAAILGGASVGLAVLTLKQAIESDVSSTPSENGTLAGNVGLATLSLSLIPIVRTLVRARPEHHWDDQELNRRIRTYNEALAKEHGLSEQQTLDAEQGR